MTSESQTSTKSSLFLWKMFVSALTLFVLCTLVPFMFLYNYRGLILKSSSPASVASKHYRAMKTNLDYPAKLHLLQPDRPGKIFLIGLVLKIKQCTQIMRP